MLFVGIDLAWSTKNMSGVAIVDGDKKKGRLLDYALLQSDSEIIDYVNKNVGNNSALIAIDAPLIVPNFTGRRVAEEMVGDLFRKYDAGAHPSNRTRLGSWSEGKIRGEELSKLLKTQGFAHSPAISKYEDTRKFFEVYPHPAMISVFNLGHVLRYKAKPARTYEFRWAAFKKYQEHLKDLENAAPGLILPKEITEKRIEDLKAQKLKDYEDMLDGVFCAYIAYYAWANPEKCAVLGNMQDGYILTPILDSMKSHIGVERMQKQLD